MRVLHKGASAKQRKIIRLLIGNLATCDSELALLFSCLLFATVVSYANNLDSDETPSNRATHPGQTVWLSVRILTTIKRICKFATRTEQNRTEQNRKNKTIFYPGIHIYNVQYFFKHRYELISFFGSEWG